MYNKNGRQRPIHFVLTAIKDGGLVAKTIEAKSLSEAVDIFEKEFSVSPQETFGPFYKKRSRVIEKTNGLTFDNEIKNAIPVSATYNGWLVNAFFLKNLKSQAYLVFIKRVDDKKIPRPQGNVIVPISELRIQ